MLTSGLGPRASYFHSVLGSLLNGYDSGKSTWQVNQTFQADLKYQGISLEEMFQTEKNHRDVGIAYNIIRNYKAL